MAGSDTAKLRLPNSGGPIWLLYARLALPLIAGVYLVSYSLIERHAASTGTFVYVIVLGGCSLALGLLLLPGAVRALRPVRATIAAVRIAHGWRDLTIPTGEVSGVGLLLRYTPGRGQRPFPGWYLTVWDGAGTAHQVDAILYFAELSGADRAPRASDYDPSAIAASKAGVAARQLHAFVARVQGPAGPLGTQARQKHPTPSGRWDVTLTCGYWSPDGELAELAVRAADH